MGGKDSVQIEKTDDSEIVITFDKQPNSPLAFTEDEAWRLYQSLRVFFMDEAERRHDRVQSP